MRESAYGNDMAVFYFYSSGPQGSFFEKKQGNRGDLREIHVTRQFFEARGHHGDLIEKTKKTSF